MIKIYEYPKCTTCRRALKWLDDNGIEYEKYDITKNIPSKELLEKLIEDNNVPLKSAFNTSGKMYREMKLKDIVPNLTVEEACEKYLSQDGMLIKRPIIINGGRAVFGFKEEKVNGLLK